VPPRSRTWAYATASRISLYQAQLYKVQHSSTRQEAFPAQTGLRMRAQSRVSAITTQVVSLRASSAAIRSSVLIGEDVF
jgi:hypothetical protein